MALFAVPDGDGWRDITAAEFHSQVIALAKGLAAAGIEPGLGTVGSIGDSRVYWLGRNPIDSRRLTEDDSWAGLMIAQGILAEADAYRSPQAHTIVRWLGADAPDEPAHVAQFVPEGPGLVLACSDGLWNYVPEAERLAQAMLALDQSYSIDFPLEVVVHTTTGSGAANSTAS